MSYHTYGVQDERLHELALRIEKLTLGHARPEIDEIMREHDFHPGLELFRNTDEGREMDLECDRVEYDREVEANGTTERITMGTSKPRGRGRKSGELHHDEVL